MTAATTSTAITETSSLARVLFLFGTLVALALVVLNLASLVGVSYARFASERLDRPESAATAAAARIASRWPGWSSRHVALHAWVLTERRDADAATAAYLEALRLAPGDPLLWSEFALALARMGRFDPMLTHAVIWARTLAPTSAAVGRSIADLGLSYWARGTPELQSLWLVEMQRELKHNRGAFLTHVLTRGGAPAFCRDAAAKLGEEQWCASIANVLLGNPN